MLKTEEPVDVGLSLGCLSASPDVPHTSKKKALFLPLWSLGEAGPVGGGRTDSHVPQTLCPLSPLPHGLKWYDPR